jgi:hypothetical protein
MFERVIGLSALFAFATIACVGGAVRAAKIDSEKLLARHYDLIHAGAYDAALAEYDPEFFANSSQASWRRSLEQVTTQLGEFRSYRAISWEITETHGTGAGINVIVACDVEYAKGHLREQLRLRRIKGDDALKIVAHSIKKL